MSVVKQKNNLKARTTLYQKKILVVIDILQKKQKKVFFFLASFLLLLKATFDFNNRHLLQSFFLIKYLPKNCSTSFAT